MRYQCVDGQVNTIKTLEPVVSFPSIKAALRQVRSYTTSSLWYPQQQPAWSFLVLAESEVLHNSAAFPVRV